MMNVVEKIENKSVQAERILIGLFLEAAKSLPPECTVVVDAETTRHSMNLYAETARDLQRAKETLSHQFPNASAGDALRAATRGFWAGPKLSTSA
ncbi:MAG: hypothetical protein AB7N80_04370 [Bdellovibrionales bacterium]